MIVDTNNSGLELVTLNASGSSDSDGTITNYSWSENDTEIATGVNPQVDFAVGTHTITLTVTDDDGATASDTVVITVQAAGATATFTPTATETITPTATPTSTHTPTATPPASGTGTGLRGEYFDDTTFTALKLTRVDPTINFNWLYGSPTGPYENPGDIHYETFGIRWTGELEAPTAGSYTLKVYRNDGVRLWIDDTLVIDAWSAINPPAGAPAVSSAEVTLSAGRHAFKMEYFEAYYTAEIALGWIPPGGSEATIPQMYLYPGVNQPPVANAGANITLTDFNGGGDESFSITGSGTDPEDGANVSYRWYQGTDTTGTPFATTAQLNDTRTVGGPYTYTLVVQDTAGLTASDTVEVTIAPQPPTNRVTSGLLALYTFDEGSGATVNDTSGVSPALPLTINNTGAVTWGAGTLTLNSSTILKTAGAATKINSAIGGSGGSGAFTLEAWVVPASAGQQGPARIITLEQDVYNSNATLGQGLWAGQPTGLFIGRVRTSTTSLNGQPELTTASGTATTTLTHVVFTRAADGATALYINGTLAASGTASGDLLNWDSNYLLALGNEPNAQSRAWLGTYHLAAVYGRALTAAEVTQNTGAGAD